MRQEPPKDCPKCESRDGWDDPVYRPCRYSLTTGVVTPERLEYKCARCRYPLPLPCADSAPL